MGPLFVILLAGVAADPSNTRETHQAWREAEQNWRKTFQAAHKDFKPLPPEAPAAGLAPLPPPQHLTQRRYVIVPASKGFQVLRIERGRLMSIDRPWDSRQAAEYAVQDLVRRDQFESGDAVTAHRQPARPAKHQVSHRKPSRPAVSPLILQGENPWEIPGEPEPAGNRAIR